MCLNKFSVQCQSKGAITSKIKHTIKHKTSAARLAQLLQPSLAFCFSLQPMTAYRPVLGCNSCATVVQQLCKSCRTCFEFYCMFYFTCDRSLMRADVSVDPRACWTLTLPLPRRPPQRRRGTAVTPAVIVDPSAAARHASTPAKTGRKRKRPLP